MSLSLLRFALVGHPVMHAASPAMHAAAFHSLGRRFTYEAVECPGPAALEPDRQGARTALGPAPVCRYAPTRVTRGGVSHGEVSAGLTPPTASVYTPPAPEQGLELRIPSRRRAPVEGRCGFARQGEGSHPWEMSR